MQIIKNKNGRAKGRVCVTKTLASMEVGETWTTSSTVIDYNYLTTACSIMTQKNGYVFQTSNRAELKGKITITRTK